MSHYLVAVCHITNFNDNMKKYAQLSAELAVSYTHLTLPTKRIV